MWRGRGCPVNGPRLRTGQEDDRGHEPPEVVLAQEQPGLPPLVQAHDAAHDVVELVRGHVEQLVARVVLDVAHEVPGRVRVLEEAEPLGDLGHLVLDQRRLAGRRGRRRSVCAESGGILLDGAGLLENGHVARYLGNGQESGKGPLE